VLQLLVTANVIPSSPVLFTLMMEELSSSEMSILTRVTWLNILEDAILHSHRLENLKSYIQWQSLCPQLLITAVSSLIMPLQSATLANNKQTNSVALSPRANYTD
jgi:hypothetical protein